MSDDAVSGLEWPERPWVRAVMVVNLTGAITGPDGRSGTISGPADREVLLGVRRFSDAIVIGAQTMRDEVYAPLRMSAERQEARRSRGLAPAPRLVIVTAGLDLPWDAPAFHESALAPLIVTASSATPERRAAVPPTCELLVAPGDRVEVPWLIDSLHDRGLIRIACEGGAALLGEFAGARSIDEWVVTLSGVVGEDRFVPRSVRSEDEFVFTRFTRRDAL
jgi:riboflavin biosynthesis pyrimidine reductase